jgi:tRNA nucleotidyltransferase (CCA-adding enzyme)
MLNLGFRQVGSDFPVFLNPITKEEYALARTERKSGVGYQGFSVDASPDVTLEEDLSRRDLTINAMAQADDGTLIDPFNGRSDLSRQVLRHVGPAFAEDPVRILRIARFAARFTDFTVAPETMTLIRNMVIDGEADHLVAERVWQELARGLMEKKPSRMLDLLRDCGALSRLLPEVDRLFGVSQPVMHHPEGCVGTHVKLVLDYAAQQGFSLPVRFACLTHDLGKGTTPADMLPRHIGHEERGIKLLQALCKRLRVPRECAELAEVVAREHGNIHRSVDLDASATLRLLERCDAIRKPGRFAEVLLACECDVRGRAGLEDTPYPQSERLLRALDQVLSVATAPVAAAAAQQGASGEQIGAAVRRARLLALSATS